MNVASDMCLGHFDTSIASAVFSDTRRRKHNFTCSNDLVSMRTAAQVPETSSRVSFPALRAYLAARMHWSHTLLEFGLVPN